MNGTRTCTVEECDQRHYARGVCKKHYQRLAATGTTDPGPGKVAADPWERILARSVRTESGCLEFHGPRDRAGYGQMRVGSRSDGTRRTTRTHRISWEHHHGQIPEGLAVRHRCDNPPCVEIDHLELGTRNDNMRDRMLRGRAAKVINAADIPSVRQRVADGESQSSVARSLGVSPGVISDIIRGRTFTWM